MNSEDYYSENKGLDFIHHTQRLIATANLNMFEDMTGAEGYLSYAVFQGHGDIIRLRLNLYNIPTAATPVLREEVRLSLTDSSSMGGYKTIFKFDVDYSPEEVDRIQRTINELEGNAYMNQFFKSNIEFYKKSLIQTTSGLARVDWRYGESVLTIEAAIELLKNLNQLHPVSFAEEAQVTNVLRFRGSVFLKSLFEQMDRNNTRQIVPPSGPNGN